MVTGLKTTSLTFTAVSTDMSATDMSTTGQCHQSDVILLCGPPHVGKTGYYREKLAVKYTRVSPKELFTADKDLSIRQLINQHVVAPLRQGRKLVIDDEHQTRKRRESFVRIIKQKCPKVKIECLSFHPCHGVAQLRWAQEFHNAWCVEHGVVDTHSGHTAETIDRWQQLMESPSDAEGFHVTDIKTYLQRMYNSRFEVPALFVQLEAVISLIEHATDVRLTEGATEALSLWSRCNPCGRIIIICDGITTRGGSLRRTLAGLTGHLTGCPVYMIEGMAGVGAFSLPPQPGILAFLVQLHHVDIENRATKYLYKTSSHMTMAVNAGVRYIKASWVFEHPHLVKTDHSATTPPVPPAVRDIQRSEKSPKDVMVSVPSVPLYEAGMEAFDGICQVKLACGHSLYLGCKDKALLQRGYKKPILGLYLEAGIDHEVLNITCQMATIRSTLVGQPFGYNDRYQNVASGRNVPVSPSTAQTHNTSVSTNSDVSLASRNRNLPSWMVTKGNKKSSQKKDMVLQCADVTVSSPSGNGNANTIYVMSEEELLSAARDLLQQVGTRSEETPETPGVQSTNPHTSKVGVAVNEVIHQESQRSATGAQSITAESSVPATQPTLDSETDHHVDTTLMILDDLFEADHGRQKKPPARLKRHPDAFDAVLSDDDAARTVDDTGQTSPGHSVITTSVDTGHTVSPVHCVTTCDGDMSPTSAATLQLLQDTVILPTTEINMTSLKQLSVNLEREKDMSGTSVGSEGLPDTATRVGSEGLADTGTRVGSEGSADTGTRVGSEGLADTVSVSPTNDVKLTDRAKRRRLSCSKSPDMSILDDLI